MPPWETLEYERVLGLRGIRYATVRKVHRLKISDAPINDHFRSDQERAAPSMRIVTFLRRNTRIREVLILHIVELIDPLRDEVAQRKLRMCPRFEARIKDARNSATGSSDSTSHDRSAPPAGRPALYHRTSQICGRGLTGYRSPDEFIEETPRRSYHARLPAAVLRSTRGAPCRRKRVVERGRGV